MRIGVDASRATAARPTGTEHYALRLIEALLAHNAAQPAPRHDFSLYFRDAPAPGRMAGARHRVMPFPRLWTHLRLSWELLGPGRPDVLFVPAHVLPLIHPLPSVVTVHDLGYKVYPEAHPPGQRAYLDWSTRFSAHGATRVIADSHATRSDLVRFYAVPPEKIRVIYPGRDEAFRRVDPGPARARYGLAGDYVLHVGTLQPRKNLVRLIEAFVAARRASPEPARLSLVLAGRPGWLSEPILARAREHAGQVRLLDYVASEDLPGLYSGALACAFPSLYEGFGFPILEAMACGAPVICSDSSSLPEVAGEAALRVDPTDTAALAGALSRVVCEPDLRADLARRGLERVLEFSWDKAARETLAVLEAAGR